MKKTGLPILLLLLTSAVAYSQEKSTPKKAEPQIRQYWFVLLTSGKNRSQDSVTAAKLQEGHLANIQKLYMEGKVKVAGPFGDDGDWQGFFVFDCPTKEEVEKLLQTDPSIAAGRLAYQIKSWYTIPVGSFVPGKPEKPLF